MVSHTLEGRFETDSVKVLAVPFVAVNVAKSLAPFHQGKKMPAVDEDPAVFCRFAGAFE